MLFLFPLIISLFIPFIRSEKSGFFNIDKEFNKTGLFGQKNYLNKYKINKDYIKSAMCHTKYNDLNLVQFASLAQIIYYDDIDRIKFYLNNSVFNGFNNIKISEIKLINKENAKLMMIDIDFKNQKGVRIFSIRGTSSAKDAILDIEMFASSFMLSLIRLFPLIGDTESYFSQKISEYLTIPLRYFKEYTLTNQYVNELSEKYELYENTERTIIFTGHSLGGGLTKLLGIKYNKQSISFSGPGVTPLEIEYSKKNNKYIKSNFVDIIPDKDIIPRVEVTSGTIYRVICNQSIFRALFKCHSIDRTVCMMGIMCDEEENYTGNLCAGIFDYSELNKMRMSIRGER